MLSLNSDKQGPSSVSEAFLLELLEKHQAAQHILEYFKNRKRHRDVTNMNRLAVRMNQVGVKISKEEVFKIFFKFEEQGYGKIFSKGLTNYFNWEINSLYLGEIAGLVLEEVYAEMQLLNTPSSASVKVKPLYKASNSENTQKNKTTTTTVIITRGDTTIEGDNLDIVLEAFKRLS